jgi:predicted phage-related endonuclease
MACSGAVLVYVPVLFEAKRFELYKVNRDEELIAVITEQERAFWQRVIDNDPPPILSTNDARLRYERSAESTVIADVDTLERIERLRSQAQALEDAAAVHDQVKAAVMAYMGESAILTDFDGKTLATWRTAKGKTYFDVDAFRTHDARRFLIK